MNKIPWASQKSVAKTLPADVCVFCHFRRLSSAAVYSADCWFDSEVKWWVHVSFIVAYLCINSFSLCWNSCKQLSESLLYYCFWSMWANKAPTLNIAFSLTNDHEEWWIHCLLISSTPLLSHSTSVYVALSAGAIEYTNYISAVE